MVVQDPELRARQDLLEVADLRISFQTPGGVIRAVNGIDFRLGKGRVLGVVGESGCGKSVMSRAILGLLPSPPATVSARAMTYRTTAGQTVELATLDNTRFRRLRGKEISMIFQEPMTSLNPVYTVGNQLMEPLLEHEHLSRKNARDQALDLLGLVGIPSPAHRIDEYPHQLSGGMRQRVMIAMAIACRPRILIADEPTTALDVTIQAQILNLLKRIGESHDTSIIFISHDLGVISCLADDVIVMYLGSIMEQGTPTALFEHPRHPYTQALIDSLPRMTSSREAALRPIQGTLPDPTNPPTGCPFHPRCPHVMEQCRREAPPLKSGPGESRVACWLH